jgi:glycolate oxidase FAD binding subunit
VNGRGEIWKAGGKVIKNVTGFDMCKLQSGAFGTLSVLTEVTIKVLPKPEEECTVLFEENSDSVAVIAMAAALNSAFDVSSAAYLPATAARRCALSAISDARGGFTAMRFEGPRPSVAYRVEAIEKRFGRGVRISGFDSSALWSSIREVHSLVPRGEQVIWRLCPTPSLAALVVAEVRARLGSAEVIYDWGGGLVWLSIATEETGDDAGAAVVRSALEKVGGNSTLVVAADDTRERVPVFEPLGGAIAELTRRIKYNFDPNGVLNPGRMQRGI